MKPSLSIQRFAIGIEPEQVKASLLIDAPLLLIVVLSDGAVMLYDVEDKVSKLIYLIPTNFSKQKLKLYYFEGYLCVVQNRSTKGFIININDPAYFKKLERSEYQVGNSSFPIGFFERDGIIHLIHGTDWNRVDITRLDNDEFLTKRGIDFKSKTNYEDFFHSELSVSPDGRRFLSNGWVWSPFDVICSYETDQFLKTFEAGGTYLDFPQTTGDLWDRPLTWVSNTLVAIGYNKAEDDELEGKYPSDLLIVDVTIDDIVKYFEFDIFDINANDEISGEIKYRSDKGWISGISSKGILVVDLEGNKIFEQPKLKVKGFSENGKSIYNIKSDQLLVYTID